MVHAFIMVLTDAGTSEEVLLELRDLPEVSEAHIVAGEWDVITEVDADEVYNVLHTASSSIQGLPGVLETKTYIALD